MGDHFRFGSVFIKKNNQTEIIFFLKKKTKPNRNRVKPTGSGSVFQGKPVQTGLARFFPVLARFFKVWLGFFGLARFSQFGSVFFRFFVGFGSVRFGFLFIKPNRTGWFFKKFNRFFFSVRFFQLFFFGFLGLISFPVFLLTPTYNIKRWLNS